MYSLCQALEIPLRGPNGEPVDFGRTIVSHGVAALPPNKVDLEARTLETTLPVARGARTVRITEVAESSASKPCQETSTVG